MKTKFQKAVHALAPGAHGANTPVLVTTGPNDGTGRKRMTLQDLFNFKELVDTAGIPEEDRELVLCSQHQNDLIYDFLHGNNNVRATLENLAKGRLEAPLLDFTLSRFLATPHFNPTTKAKLAFGAIPTATDQKASVFYYRPDMFRAAGSTKQYADEPDTQTQEWRYNVRHYYIILPRKQRAIGAIVSDNV